MRASYLFSFKFCFLSSYFAQIFSSQSTLACSMLLRVSLTLVITCNAFLYLTSIFTSLCVYHFLDQSLLRNCFATSLEVYTRYLSLPSWRPAERPDVLFIKWTAFVPTAAWQKRQDARTGVFLGYKYTEKARLCPKNAYSLKAEIKQTVAAGMI